MREVVPGRTWGVNLAESSLPAHRRRKVSLLSERRETPKLKIGLLQVLEGIHLCGQIISPKEE